MRNTNHTSLPVWIPTGDHAVNGFHIALRILSHPAFLFSVAVAAVTSMLYFNLDWRIGAIAPSAVGLAIGSILLRRRAKGKLLISERQARKMNDFCYFSKFAGMKYLSHIDTKSERTKDDYTISTALFRCLGEALITLGLFDTTGQSKIKFLSGKELELIEPLTFYTDFCLSASKGYVLLMPSVTLINKVASVDEKVIYSALREVGLVDWATERVSYDDYALFILTDEKISRAYDFSGAE